MPFEKPKAEPGTQPNALQRLRDRTDELELIISSLTIFALFSLPGWLFESFSLVYTHLSTALAIASVVGIALIAGVSYGLAACFVVHLMARAYWVGLIGLRYVFPEGIDWNKTPGIGPLTRQHYQANLPDLDTVIARTDRLASSLFAVISLLTLGMLWVGTIILLTLVVAGQIGARFGLTNAGIGIGSLALVLVLGGVPALLWLIDAQLGARFPRLQQGRFFTGFVRILRRLAGVVYPQRLILPVQLTLQSNTRPVIFFLALIAGTVAIVMVGNARFAAWQSFSLSGQFTYFGAEEASAGFRSTYYEDMASPKDRLRAWPRISSFDQNGSFVTVFLPYQPLRDNLILDQFCSSDDAVTDRTGCLRRLWSVSINDQLVDMDGFVTAERMDIRMRGLIGVVPMAGLAPGMHRLNVVWNPDANEADEPLDDRYAGINTTYRIPFVFTPGFERALQDAN